METVETMVKMTKAVKAISRHPIIIKVSVDQDYLSVAKSLTGIAEAISLNSVPWKTIYGTKTTPLWKLEREVGGGGGSVSGRPAQEFNWKAVQELSEKNYIPVIGPSIMEFDDLSKVRALGAKAISFGAIHLRTP